MSLINKCCNSVGIGGYCFTVFQHIFLPKNNSIAIQINLNLKKKHFYQKILHFPSLYITFIKGAYYSYVPLKFILKGNTNIVTMLATLCLAFDKQLEPKGGCRDEGIIPPDSKNNSLARCRHSHLPIPIELPHQMFHSKPV